MKICRVLMCFSVLMTGFAVGAQAQVQCLNNVVTNGDFSSGLVIVGDGSMPASSVASWSLLTRSPQVGVAGCDTPGHIQMWGNLVVGESIQQALASPGIRAGKTYRASLRYQLELPGPDPQDEVSVRLAASIGAPSTYPPLAGTDVIGVTPLTSSSTCVAHTFPVWTAPNDGSYLTVNAENGSSIDDGFHHSFARIDDICIQELSLGHFTGYAVKTTSGTPTFSKFGPILLGDQFGTGKYDVLKPMRLLLPANKNNEGVVDEDTHLKEYQIRWHLRIGGTKGTTPVRITNQCNDLQLDVGRPRSLLVPTSKTPPPGSDVPPAPDPQFHNVDHFLCYDARVTKGDVNPNGFPKGIQVDVVDQFQTRRYDLRMITKLCNPVDKNVADGDPPLILSGPDAGNPKPIQPSPIRNPDDHLVCYRTRLAKKLIPQNGCGCDTNIDPTCTGTLIEPAQESFTEILGVNVNNQFGPEVLHARKTAEFCIPSQKILVP